MKLISASLKRIVAIRLISGHIHITETAEMARTRWNGFSLDGSTIRKAVFFAIFPTKKKSRMKAARSHYDQFMESGEKHASVKSSDIQSDVVTDHGIDHHKDH